MSEELESVQWFRDPWTEVRTHRSCCSAFEKASVKRQALVFTDTDSLVSSVKKDDGQSHLESIKCFAQVDPCTVLMAPPHVVVTDVYDSSSGTSNSA